MYQLTNEGEKSIKFSNIYMDNVNVSIYQEVSFGVYSTVTKFNTNATTDIEVNIGNRQSVWLLVKADDKTSSSLFRSSVVATKSSSSSESGSDWKTAAIIFITLTIILSIGFIAYIVMKAKREKGSKQFPPVYGYQTEDGSKSLNS